MCLNKLTTGVVPSTDGQMTLSQNRFDSVFGSTMFASVLQLCLSILRSTSAVRIFLNLSVIAPMLAKYFCAALRTSSNSSSGDIPAMRAMAKNEHLLCSILSPLALCTTRCIPKHFASISHLWFSSSFFDGRSISSTAFALTGYSSLSADICDAVCFV